MSGRVARWLDLRPGEGRMVALSFCGAFLAIGFLVLGRSIREALFLARFPVESLPYVTAAVAISSIPAVGIFTRAISRSGTRRIVGWTVGVVGLGIAGLWPAVASSGAAVVAFYLWTAIGTLLLTSGFWLVTAELFPVRGAKRLFGLVAAGGTAGAMVAGNLLAAVSGSLGLTRLIPGLLLLLALFLAVQRFLPAADERSPGASPERPASAREGLRLAWRTPHLRTVALVVAIATVASTLIDFQFKDWTQRTMSDGEALAGFFGAFYGWTGAISFGLQILVTGRLIGRAGIAASLSVLPAFLLLGSVGLFALPGLLVATAVRGADTSLRRSVHRSLLELLFVPVSPDLRRRTKTFVDSVADSASEGIGAAIVFVVVTAAGLPSRWLSVLVAALALWLFWLARRAQRSYRATVTDELRAGAEASGRDRPDPLTATFGRLDPRLDLERLDAATATLGPSGVSVSSRAAPDEEDGEESAAGEHPGGTADLREILRDLARSETQAEATERLAADEDAFLDRLAALLRDPSIDFAIRRRIPAVLGTYASPRADAALLDGILAPRFEVRYRSAIGLVRRRKRGLAVSDAAETKIWEAIRAEVSRERPVWELQRLLDADDPVDDFVAHRVDTRGQLSLEHTFRLLSLVLEPASVRSAYHALSAGDANLESLSLEYLEGVLPDDVRRRLWPFIGDLSEHQRRRQARPLDQVVSDLVTPDATYFVSEKERGEVRRLLGEADEEDEGEDEDADGPDGNRERGTGRPRD